jgi:hypothetical protein
MFFNPKPNKTTPTVRFNIFIKLSDINKCTVPTIIAIIPRNINVAAIVVLFKFQIIYLLTDGVEPVCFYFKKRGSCQLFIPLQTAPYFQYQVGFFIIELYVGTPILEK